MRRALIRAVCLAVICASVSTLLAAPEARRFEVGVATVDVTPSEPIRLTGYAVRKTNSAGVEQKLWAKALAIGNNADDFALLMTLDNCGISEGAYRELVRRLARHGIRQEQLALCLSHTHAGPCTTDWAPNIFGQDLPPEQRAVIDRYTRKLLDQLEQAAVEARQNAAPSHLYWSRGKLEFARNRRTAGGPVDHDLPVLKVTDPEGKLRGLVANYACHCTTLGGEFNRIHGDWAGAAQAALEREHKGATAFITIGCGADANPHPRGGPDGGLAFANQHGAALAAEVKRLLQFTFRPLTEPLSHRWKEIRLPFDEHFTREQWEKRAREQGVVGYHARKHLARLDAGQKLPTDLYYPIVTWHFGEALGLIFLPGEVVVDYSLRLKKEFDAERLWISAYANYVPCYIPSRRILKEGGYEAESSLWYYDRATRLAPATEDLIIDTVGELLPQAYAVKENGAELPAPRSPAASLASIRTRADLHVELAVSEPLIRSPVWIDWSTDGRLWVCEMYDYPSGLDAQGKAGGRIRVLSDHDRNGTYETATTFLDGVPFPTGVMPWRSGAFICAAPDILYAEDTDGDGRADRVQTNYAGFATHNYQARVNGLIWGVDGWIYGSSGLFGGTIKNLGSGVTVDLGARDFRFHPSSGELEPAAGLSQQGRTRDDFSNWFGNDNSTLLWHYPLAEEYMRRNAAVSFPQSRVNVSGGVAEANQLFPISRTLERFNDPHMANRVTGACGPEIYRDDLLGTNYHGNLFVCEPVHNLVTRRILEPKGVTFAMRRDTTELQAEFLASTDNWFRPVQARTGPDGALWIVDMYRFVVEHPRWIPTNRLAQLDVRAGAEMGRLYRVSRRNRGPRPIQNLAALPTLELARTFDTINGPTRDLVHLELANRDAVALNRSRRRAGAAGRREVGAVMSAMAKESPFPGARAHALWLAPEAYVRALADRDARVRREALRLAAFDETAEHGETFRRMVQDDDPGVRFQLVLAMGQPRLRFNPELLTRFVHEPDRWMRAALLTSARAAPLQLLEAVGGGAQPVPGRNNLVSDLIATALATPQQLKLDQLIAAIVRGGPDNPSVSALTDLAALLGMLERKSFPLAYIEKTYPGLDQMARLRTMVAYARQAVTNQAAPAELRRTGLRFFSIPSVSAPEDLPLLVEIFAAGEPEFSQAALQELRARNDAALGSAVLEKWPVLRPEQRQNAISLLAARREWILAFLQAVEREVVAASEIPPSSRTQWTAHRDEAIRQAAARVFKAPASDARAVVLAGYREVASLTPQPPRGAESFERNCASCHAFRGRGHAVGPNLAEFAGKSVDDFVVAILDPNAAIEPKHVAYTVETRDGRSLLGLVRDENASSLTVVQGGGLTETILRSDLARLRASPLSLMPEGFEQSISPQEMADLIGWLKQSAPTKFGSAPADAAGRARQQFLAENARGALRIVYASETLDYPSWMGRLPLAHCRQTDGHSRVVVAARAVDVSNTVARFRLPVAMGFASQPAGKFSLRTPKRPLLDFDVALSDRTWEGLDGKLRMTYTVVEANNEDSNGVLTIEVATELLDDPPAATFEVIGSQAASQRWFGVYRP